MTQKQGSQLDTSRGFRPLDPLTRAALFVVGTIMLAVGMVGVYLPGLPTTPFLLVAAACYLRSSERLFHWLIRHPRIGPQLHSVLETKAVPWKVKAISLLLAWAVLGGLALFVAESLFWKLLLVGVAVVKTAVMLSLKTLER